MLARYPNSVVWAPPQTRLLCNASMYVDNPPRPPPEALNLDSLMQAWACPVITTFIKRDSRDRL